MASQQSNEIETGKEIIKEILGKLALELKQPRINDLTYMVTDEDFDRQQVSIVDPNQKKVVMKVEQNHLADAPSMPDLLRKLEAQLRASVRTHYKIQTSS